MTQHNGDILRVTPIFNYNEGSDRFVNQWTLQLELTGDVADVDMVDALGIWLETVYEDILDQQSELYVYNEWDWKNVTQNVVYPAEQWPTYTAGVKVGDVMPGGLSAYGYGRTAYGRVIAKKYFNGMVESNNSAGGAPVTAVVDAVANVLSAGWGIVTPVAGITIHGVIDTTLHGYAPVLSVVVPALWRWLRRRMPGIGG